MTSASERAEKMVLKGEVQVRHQVLDRIVATARSASDPDLWHTIIWEPTGWRCDCVAGLYRRRCSHIAATIIELERLGRQKRGR